MKVGVILSLLLLSYGSLAQEQDLLPLEKRGKGFEVGLVFSPGLSYRSYLKKSELGQGSEFLNELDEPIFAFSTGVDLGYQSSKVLGFSIGLRFSQLGFLMDSDNADNRDDSLIEAWQRYTLRYVDIPLLLTGVIGEGRIRLRVAMGVTGNLFIQGESKIFTIGEDLAGSPFQFEDSRKLNELHNLSPTISAGVDITIHRRFGIRIEPAFMHQIIYLEGNERERGLWMASLNVVLRHSTGH